MPAVQGVLLVFELPGARNHAHLKHHRLDEQYVTLPGANMLAHLSVFGILWNRLRSLGAALCALLILKALYAVKKHNYRLPAIIRTLVRYGKR